jgi:hypothetical protein
MSETPESERRQLAASVAAKNFGRLLDELDDRHVAVTRYGRAAAFVLSPAEYARLTGYEDRRRTLAIEELTEAEWDEIAAAVPVAG